MRNLNGLVRYLGNLGVKFWALNIFAIVLAFPVNLLLGYQVYECNPLPIGMFEYRCQPQLEHPYLVAGLFLGISLVLMLVIWARKEAGTLFMGLVSIIHLSIPQIFLPETLVPIQIDASGYTSPFVAVVVVWAVGFALTIGISFFLLNE